MNKISIFSIFLVLAAMPVLAQEAEQNYSRLKLEEVLVTGEKIERSLMETTTAISVFNAESIADHGDKDLADMLRRAGNTMSNEEGNISIRGISQQGAGGGNGSPLISVQVDGVTLDVTSQNGASAELFDIAQVEVLRGAQSSSQGRNSLAGAVIVNTRDPGREWDANMRLIATEHDGGGLAVAGGGPLSDSFAFRIAGIANRDDGFITHQPDGNANFARQEEQLLRLKVAYEPSYIEGFDSLLTLSSDRKDGQPAFNYERGVAGTDPSQRRTSIVNERTRDLVESDLISWRNRYQFSEQFTLTSITAYMLTYQNYQRDFDGVDDDNGFNPTRNDGKNFTQELRFNFTDVGPYTGVIGLYAGSFKRDSNVRSDDIIVRSNDLTGTPADADFLYVQIDFASRQVSEAKNIAVFGEVDIDLPGNLTATLGLRYDQETLDAKNRFDTNQGDAFFNTPNGVQSVPLAGQQLINLLDAVFAQQPGINILPILLASGTTPSTNGLQGGETDYSALLPKAALRYDVSDNWSVFTSYSKAYRAGGVDVNLSTGELLPFDPEYTDNVEIGMRGELPDQGLQISANVFYIQWQDQQIPVLREQFRATDNAANSELYGADLSVIWRPWKPLALTGSFGVVHTEFLEYEAAREDYTGNEFIFAPKFTGSLGAIFRHDSWMASANVSHSEQSFTLPSNMNDEISEARTLLDIRVGWEGVHVSAYLFGKNITNEDYISETYQFRDGYVGAPSPRGSAAYGRPRELGIQLELRY